jgi:RNA polymerase sigma-70 factor (ECF subfamily)
MIRQLMRTTNGWLSSLKTALLPLGNDAADVLQDTSMILWRKFDNFELGTNFFAWACKIARLEVMKYRERKVHSARVFDAQLIEKLVVEAADADVVGSVSLQALENCLGKLSENDRLLIQRRYQPGSSVRQLAAEVGRTANSLSKSLGRIRRALVECVDRTLTREARE